MSDQWVDADGTVRLTGTFVGGQPDIGVVAGAIQPCCGYRGIAPMEGYVTSTLNLLEFATGVDQDILLPWFLPTAITVTHLLWRVAGGSPVVGLYRLGLYAASAAWQPSSLLWDSGEQDGEVDTIHDDTVALTLPAGRYLQAWAGDADAQANSLALDSLDPQAKGAIWPDLGVVTSDLEALTPAGFLLRARAFGAFPDPGGAGTATKVTTNLCGALFCKAS